MTNYVGIARAMRLCKYKTGENECAGCKIHDECYAHRNFLEDYAADIIEELLTEYEKAYRAFEEACETNDALFGAIATLKAERDAAVADLRKCAFETDHECYYCKQYCKTGLCSDYDLKANKWEWRGFDYENTVDT